MKRERKGGGQEKTEDAGEGKRTEKEGKRDREKKRKEGQRSFSSIFI